MAQAPGSGERVRVAGTVEKLDGDNLGVKATAGSVQTVTWRRIRRSMALRNAVSATSNKETSSPRASARHRRKNYAVEVRFFRKHCAGIGEGQLPWQREAGRGHDNATVGTVSQTSDGGVIHVTYKGGESEYIVEPDVPVVAMFRRTERC